MTQAPVLSQAEIDALMHGLGGASNSGAAGVSVAGPGAVQPFDWLGLPRLTQGALPALDVVNQRVVRELEASLRAAMAHPVDVFVHSATVRRYSDFLDETPSPTACAVVNLFPLNGQGLILCDLPLGDAWIEALYGGNVHPASKSPGAPAVCWVWGRSRCSICWVVWRKRAHTRGAV
jgi:flagellar motor switch protein FliM